MDRNSFHLAHLEASGAFQPGMAVAYEFHETSRAPYAAAGYQQLVVGGSLNGNRQAVKFFLCGLYSENGLAGPWEAVSGRSDARPSVFKSARPGTPESELAD